MTDTKTALVLGATGGVGGEVARQLVAEGWTLTALTRGLGAATERRDGLTWMRGDALDPQAVTAAAAGCSVIVHAVNPPGYRGWAKVVLPMLDNSIAAAIKLGATVVLPGTVYNFGPDAFPVLSETSPQHPVTRKGAIRVEMEQRLLTASTRGARVLIVRAGDYFGPRAANTWFAQGLVKPGAPVKKVQNPAAPGVGHQWGYLPDVARTILELLARRESLEPFARFHMAGHWDQDGTQMPEAIRRIIAAHTGRSPRIAGFPWALLRLASPFVETLREMQEMRYLWRQPLRMDNARLLAVLDHEPHTPLDEAVAATLRDMGVTDTATRRAPPSSRQRIRTG
jgi:nucleoside-diphosphate-sugar epimerase